MEFEKRLEDLEEENLFEEIDDIRIKVDQLENKIIDYCKDSKVDVFVRWNVLDDFCSEFGRGFQLVERFQIVEFQSFMQTYKQDKEYFINDIIVQFKDWYKYKEGFNFKQETMNKLVSEIKEECLQKFIYSFTLLN